MKKFALILMIIACYVPALANHIAGGELFYEYVGAGSSANSSIYKVTMRLFRDCNSSGQTLETETVVVGVYSNNNQQIVRSVNLPVVFPINTIKLNTNAIPCLLNPPVVCFQVGIFTGEVELPNIPEGYTLTWIRCCRSDNITNLGNSFGVGATFTTSIPGNSVLTTGHNNSPQFNIKDTALVCQNKNFVLDFGATDSDHDSLSYSFCEAYLGGTSSNPNPGNQAGGPPANLSLNPLPYQNPFSGSSPLGPEVTINQQTGKITGKAPGAGRYVINVCVSEYRNGILLNIHRKDFLLEVGNCDFAASEPTPTTGAYCSDYSVPFENSSTSSAIISYAWDFGVPNVQSDTSNAPNPIYTYTDTGLYTIKLIVRGSAGCVDTGYATLGVYPGFKADFNTIGSCYKSPFNFQDKTTARFGTVNSWYWNFGDVTTNADTSIIKNPAYTYPSIGSRDVKLVATSTKGCIDSITKTISVTDLPLLQLPFRDTLICSLDSLQLQAVGTGNFTWTPTTNIINSTSASPTVFPKDTITYVVALDQNGCTTKDSIRVNVVDSISIYAGADTTICKTDNITLLPVSIATKYNWTPIEGIIGSSTSKNPIVQPLVNTTYLCNASLGRCLAKDDIAIKVVDYPKANAGPDVIICFGDRTNLSSSITGSSFSWTPTGSLINSNSLNPIALPKITTTYSLTVRDTLGCPKPFSDEIVVTVTPPVKAFAGNDTNVVANQPLQLTATGGQTYVWSPSTGINNPFIANPIITLGASVDSMIYKVRVSSPGGCFADDFIKVKVFKTAPDLFIPTAFTPNGDLMNDVLKPIAAGIKNLDYFKIFNRWGQLLFSTSSLDHGWDGTFKGVRQASGTYVFAAHATDYQGKEINKKGTVVLIR